MPYVTSTPYRRFIILSDARTGSHMLAQALDSSPLVICFRELFNGQLDLIQYDVEGYDNRDEADFALRKEDPLRFLRERIFCEHPGIDAVGFKYHYMHWTFPGVLDELTGDDDLYVLHLTRRNQLRMFVSLKLAEETGVWLVRTPAGQKPSIASQVLRAPANALARLRGTPVPEIKGREKPRVHVDVTEFYEFMVRADLRKHRNVERFSKHPMHEVVYEEMVADPEPIFDEAQRFLGLEPIKLTIETRRQNPEPLRNLIENYEELREAYAGTNAEPFFDD